MMKIRPILILVANIYCCGFLYPIDIKDVDMKTVFEIKNGTKYGEIAYNLDSLEEAYGIEVVRSTGDGGWLLVAPQNRKTFVLNDRFDLKKSMNVTRYQISPTSYIDKSSGIVLWGWDDGCLRIYSPVKDKISKLVIDGNSRGRRSEVNAIYFNEFDFAIANVEGATNRIFGVQGAINGQAEIAPIESFLNSQLSSGIAAKGFRLIGSDLLFRGFLVSSSFKDFLRVSSWDKEHMKISGSAGSQAFQNIFLGVSPILSLIDGDGNFYWIDSDRFCYIFDSTGGLINYLVLPEKELLAHRRIAFHPSGDLYIFSTEGSGEPIKVSVVSNFWTPSAKKAWERDKKISHFITELPSTAFAFPFGLWREAIVNVGNTVMRNNPDNKSNVVAQLRKGMPLTLLAEDRKSGLFGSNETLWYKAITWEGVQGWVLGSAVGIINQSSE